MIWINSDLPSGNASDFFPYTTLNNRYRNFSLQKLLQKSLSIKETSAFSMIFSSILFGNTRRGFSSFSCYYFPDSIRKSLFVSSVALSRIPPGYPFRNCKIFFQRAPKEASHQFFQGNLRDILGDFFKKKFLYYFLRFLQKFLKRSLQKFRYRLLSNPFRNFSSIFS